jgi:hypothetical protein
MSLESLLVWLEFAYEEVQEAAKFMASGPYGTTDQYLLGQASALRKVWWRIVDSRMESAEHGVVV